MLHKTGQGSLQRGDPLPPLAKTYPTDRGLLPHYRGYVPGEFLSPHLPTPVLWIAPPHHTLHGPGIFHPALGKLTSCQRSSPSTGGGILLCRTSDARDGNWQGWQAFTVPLRPSQSVPVE